MIIMTSPTIICGNIIENDGRYISNDILTSTMICIMHVLHYFLNDEMSLLWLPKALLFVKISLLTCLLFLNDCRGKLHY